jgi:membrane protein implicated in regulation of membrane protease activity
MNKKTFWILAITYAAITFIFNNVFHTAFGAFSMMLSFFAVAFAIISFIYLLIQSFLRPFFYNRKKGSTDK